jgi:hypothetical protein
VKEQYKCVNVCFYCVNGKIHTDALKEHAETVVQQFLQAQLEFNLLYHLPSHLWLGLLIVSYYLLGF